MGRSRCRKAALSGAAFLFGLTACAGSGGSGSWGSLVEQARNQGFVLSAVQAGGFELASYARRGGGYTAAPSEVVTIYIEGDGAPWPTPFMPPHDPTPLRPVALAMALGDQRPAVVYLGRPCQYLLPEALRQCHSVWWIERRFAPQVIAAYDVAIDKMKESFSAHRVRLVGYSGGGVIAMLVAARRKDVASVVTVAAPLAVGAWLTWHGASPLTGSLDPEISLGQRVLPPSLYFVGARDEVVPPFVVQGFAQRKGGRVVVVPGFEHECCWGRDWGRFLHEASALEDGK